MIAYKVLFKGYSSSGSVAGPLIKKHSRYVRYKWKKVNKPHKGCGPLCCFKTLEKAKFYFSGLRYDIYKVRIKKSRQQHVIWYMYNKNNKKYKLITYIHTVYPDTILASQIIILKKIQ